MSPDWVIDSGRRGKLVVFFPLLSLADVIFKSLLLSDKTQLLVFWEAPLFEISHFCWPVGPLWTLVLSWAFIVHDEEWNVSLLTIAFSCFLLSSLALLFSTASISVPRGGKWLELGQYFLCLTLPLVFSLLLPTLLSLDSDSVETFLFGCL